MPDTPRGSTLEISSLLNHGLRNSCTSIQNDLQIVSACADTSLQWSLHVLKSLAYHLLTAKNDAENVTVFLSPYGECLRMSIA
jgi:hypothetical protein